MAIGTAAAIGIGLAGVGSAVSASSANKASKRAAQTSQANTDANTALARDIYGQNKQIMSPFVQRGNAAGDQINALLGLGGSQQQVQPNALSQFGDMSWDQFQGATAGMSAEQMRAIRGGGSAASNYGLGDSPGMTYQGGGGNQFAQYVQTNPDLMAEFARVGNQFGGDMGAYGQFHYGKYGQNEGRVLPGQQQTTMQMGPQTSAPGQTPQQAAEGAFDTFRNSTGYQFRRGEGMDGVTSAYAGIGGLQSGAAMRGIQEYGQNFASNEFGNYMGALSGQQAVGAGSASALAGVGQNFAGTVIGQNNFNAQNQMGAQLGRQNALANVAGVLGGGIFGSLSGGGGTQGTHDYRMGRGIL
jgi:hypothetical protein